MILGRLQFIILTVTIFGARSQALSPDGLSLLAFKAAISDDPSASLARWSEDDADPCRWPGVSCANVTGSLYPRVVGIAVSGKNLSGYIPSELGRLLFLRRLNLHANRLAGPVPAALFNATSLHSLYLSDNLLSGPFPHAACRLPRLQNLDLSRNSLSGDLPADLLDCRQLQRLVLSQNRFSGSLPAGVWSEMTSLVQLDLSSNQFNGSIPPDLGELGSLGGTLNLSHNRLSGQIPSSLGNLPPMVSLDLRYNNLSGEIPSTGSLANQGPTAFLNNAGLCGFPLQIPCKARTAAGPMTTSAPAASTQREATEGVKGKLRASMIVLITLADAAGVAMVGVVLVYLYWKLKDQEKCCAKLGSSGDRRRRRRRWCLLAGARKKGAYSSSSSSSSSAASEDEESSSAGGGGGGGGGAAGDGELVTMDKGFRVELEELLRASAYVLGKGGTGLVYKVVVGDGLAVAVRRLGEGGGGGGGSGGQQQQRHYKEFSSEVGAMGRVRHQNVVRLRAYYWAQDEKLLISDFVPNGNLASALRGRSGQATLSWSTRLSIAKGAARGLAHLHDCSPRKFVHGAVKPSNILLDADFNPLVSDFNLHRLLPITSAANSLAPPTAAAASGFMGYQYSATAKSAQNNPYRAPELRAAASAGVVVPYTHKSDVYSFGVVLLEMLTGRTPEPASAPSPTTSMEKAHDLVWWVRKGFDEARPLSDLADPGLMREAAQAQARKEILSVFHIALSCTEAEPEARPRMKTVSENLDKVGA